MQRPPSVIKGTNGQLLAIVGPIHIGLHAPTIDLTYGEGNWWTDWRPDMLVTNDIDLAKAAMLHEDTRHTGAPDQTYEAATLDLPYVVTGGKGTSTLKKNAAGLDLWGRFGMRLTEGTPWEWQCAVITPSIIEAYRLLAPGGRLLLKSQNYTTGGRKQAGVRWCEEAAKAAGLKWKDEFIHHTGLGPQPKKGLDGKERVWRGSHQAHSVLSVFERPQRRKSRRAEPAPGPAIEWGVEIEVPMAPGSEPEWAAALGVLVNGELGVHTPDGRLVCWDECTCTHGDHHHAVLDPRPCAIEGCPCLAYEAAIVQLDGVATVRPTKETP